MRSIQNQRIVNELVNKIKYHRKKYYYDCKPEISDSTYDELEKKLAKYDPTNEILTTVGCMECTGKTYKHDIPMGSIESITYEKDDNDNLIGDGLGLLRKWIDNHKYTLYWSLKADGMAVSLKYKNGKLFQALTRHNGSEGEDVTYNASLIESLPNTIPDKRYIEIRGEIIIPNVYFNQYMYDEYANSRNAAAGCLKRHTPNIHTRKGLQFLAYNVYIKKVELPSIDAKINFLKLIPGMGYLTQNMGPITKQVIDTILLKRHNLDHRIDGLVMTVGHTQIRDTYGYTGFNCKGIIAFKFKAAEATTKISNIIWNTGRTGKITPVVHITPVELDGTTVSKCSMHNIDEINRKDVAIGDTIVIFKGGDIIPQVKKVLVKSDSPRVINYPDICPSCCEPTIVEGTHVLCINEYCKARLREKIIHFLHTMEIKDIGPARIDQLINAGYVGSISDIYKVTSEELSTLDRIGESSINNYHQSLNRRKNVPMHTFIASMGIKQFGKHLSKVVCKKYNTIDSLFAITESQLESIDDIGKLTATYIVEGLNKLKDEINTLLTYINFSDVTEIKHSFITGKVFCCTGALSKPRKVYQNIIEECGGEYKGISKKLDYLIIGSGAVQKKIDKAKSYGSIILTETEFEELLND